MNLARIEPNRAEYRGFGPPDVRHSIVIRHSIVMRYRIRIPEGIKCPIISNSIQNMKWHDITNTKVSLVKSIQRVQTPLPTTRHKALRKWTRCPWPCVSCMVPPSRERGVSGE